MNRWGRLALQLLSVVLFGFILWWAGPEAWQRVLAGDRRVLAIAFFVHGSASMVAAIRLRFITTTLLPNAERSWRRYYYLTMSARALGLILPRSLSAIGGKAVGLRALGVPLKHAVWIVMLDNLFDVVLLGFLTLPALLFFQELIGVAMFLFLLPVTITAVAVLFWWGMRPGRLAALLNWLHRFPRLAQRLNIDSGRLLPEPRTGIAALGWSVLLNGIIVSSFYFIGRSVGTPISWPLLLASYPVVQLSLIIAIAPGGLGIFDLGWLGLLRLGGVGQEAALAFVVAQRAYIYVFVLAWAAFSGLLSLTVRKKAPV